MNDCTDVRTSLGVYVVGALDPEAGAAGGAPGTVPRLPGQARRAGTLPAMLGRVEREQLERVTGPPPELLDGLLARAAERRRGWLGRLTGGRGIGGGPRSPPSRACCWSSGACSAVSSSRADRTAARRTRAVRHTRPAATAERISAANPASNIKGYVVLRKKEWGTEVELHLAGVPRGRACSR